MQKIFKRSGRTSPDEHLFVFRPTHTVAASSDSDWTLQEYEIRRILLKASNSLQHEWYPLAIRTGVCPASLFDNTLKRVLDKLARQKEAQPDIVYSAAVKCRLVKGKFSVVIEGGSAEVKIWPRRDSLQDDQAKALQHFPL